MVRRPQFLPKLVNVFQNAYMGFQIRIFYKVLIQNSKLQQNHFSAVP